MENIKGYDAWKTTPPDEPEPKEHCAKCGNPIYEGEELYKVDGGICKRCIDDEYMVLV